MIQILGANEGQEHRSAEKLKGEFQKIWPDLEQNSHDRLLLFVGYRIHSARVKEIDIVIVADFGEPRSIECPSGPLYVSNFVILLEVKGQDGRNVEFSGGNANVRYPDRWHSASEQSDNQLHAFKKHLKQSAIPIGYISNLILFTQLRHSDLPEGNFIASNSTVNQILEEVLRQDNLFRRRGPKNRTLRVATRENLEKLDKKFRSIQPTPLDRKKMDRIASDAWRRRWLDDIGQKQVIIRGRAGTGKTIALMQLADHAFRRQNKRSLLITYNKALVADLKRLKQLMGIPNGVDGAGIEIMTIHKLIFELANDMPIQYTEFLDEFREIKNQICSYFDEEVFTRDDLDRLRHQKPRIYDFDIVFVDEGQDCPDDEVKIIRWLFGVKNIVIADGVDQYVREQSQSNKKMGWDRSLPTNDFVRRNLKKGVRMKYNLSLFMADIAWECFGLHNWDVEPVDEAIGGRVLVYEGDLASRPDIFKELCSEARSEGNFPIDMLACVPPSFCPRDPSGENISRVAQNYRQSGIQYWDGSSKKVRENPPTSRDQLRIVQYESCRGLEGWTVLNFGFDELWDTKFRQGIRATSLEAEAVLDPKDYARKFAGQWLMIPLSRAIDTLVINVGTEDTELKRTLKSIFAGGGHDCLEWIKL